MSYTFESRYSKQLKSPKWQKLRLQIMKRARFKCEECGSEEDTLNVHHGYYRKGADPWDYPSDTLRCLCENCHKRAEDTRKTLYAQIGTLNQTEIEILTGMACGLNPDRISKVTCDANSASALRGLAIAITGICSDLMANIGEEISEAAILAGVSAVNGQEVAIFLDRLSKKET